jgi:single-strand DNA-binding protein
VRVNFNKEKSKEMLGYSKIQIMGNLGNTPEMRYLPSGDHVVNFSVAVNRRYKDRENNQKEVTDWYRICAFNGVGTACANHLKRGDAIFVEGRLQVRTFDSRDGEQTSVEIVPSLVRFLGSARGTSGDDSRPMPGQPRKTQVGTVPGIEGTDGLDPEDVPF